MPTPSAPDRATLTIEADTVEDALARLNAEAGPEARILRAGRSRRGGVAGFFAREVVEIVAEVPTPAGGVDDAFARLLALHDGRDEIVAAESKEPPSSTPVFGMTWDGPRLLTVLPDRLASVLAPLDPADDVGHIATLAEVVAPLCRPLPGEPAAFSGRRAERLRTAAGLPASPDGPLHVVLDDRLPEDLPARPSIVSWVTESAAVPAVSLALGTGAALGFGMRAAFGSPAVRATPVDVAIAIREAVRAS